MFIALTVLALLLPQGADTTVAVQRGQRLEVNAHSGDITVHAWSRNAVRVHATLDEHARLEIDQSPNAVSVRSAQRGSPQDADYEITVPTWMGLTLSGVDAEIKVDGVQGPISAETVNGTVTVKGGDGIVSLRSVQGAVSLEGAKGRIDVTSVNDDVTLTDVSGELHVESVNGEIRLERVESDNTEATSVNGSILYNGTIRAGGRYHLVTHNGDVTVTVPENADALVAVSTFQGDFESDFPVTLRERRSQRFTFTLGGGSARIELESFQGTIRLKRPGSHPPKSKSDE